MNWLYNRSEAMAEELQVNNLDLMMVQGSYTCIVRNVIQLNYGGFHLPSFQILRKQQIFNFFRINQLSFPKSNPLSLDRFG